MQQLNVNNSQYVVQAGDYSSFTFTQNMENLREFKYYYNKYKSELDLNNINWDELESNENIGNVDFALKTSRNSKKPEIAASISGSGLSELQNIIDNLPKVKSQLKSNNQKVDFHRPQIMIIFSFGQGTFVSNLYIRSWEGDSAKSFSLSYLSKGIPVKTGEIDRIFTQFGLKPPQEVNAERTHRETVDVNSISKKHPTQREGIFTVYSLKNPISKKTLSDKLATGCKNTIEVLVDTPEDETHRNTYRFEVMSVPHIEEAFFYNFRGM